MHYLFMNERVNLKIVEQKDQLLCNSNRKYFNKNIKKLLIGDNRKNIGLVFLLK